MHDGRTAAEDAAYHAASDKHGDLSAAVAETAAAGPEPAGAAFSRSAADVGTAAADAPSSASAEAAEIAVADAASVAAAAGPAVLQAVHLPDCRRRVYYHHHRHRRGLYPGHRRS